MLDGVSLQDGWYRLDAVELAGGTVAGQIEAPASEARRPMPRPIDVLRAIVERALRRTPCMIAFSGGRDSSALLAVATDVARSQGLPAPIPVTRRFVDDAPSDEASWQLRVIRHLGLTEWVQLEQRGECDLLGPLAVGLLRANGPLWPPTAHVNIPLLELARGGTLVTGAGGDEVFGVRRVTPLRHLRGGATRRRAAVRALPGCIGPASLRRWHRRRRLTDERLAGWLTPSGRVALRGRLVHAMVDEPLSWRTSTRRLVWARSWIHGAATMDRVAMPYDVRMVHPLVDPDFLDSLATHWSRLGPMSRADAMRTLFGRLLPDKVLYRTSKATFNTALFSEHSRRFADQWDGQGVDTTLVDVQRLREAWSARIPDARSFPMLQAAWWASLQSAHPM